MFDRTGTYKHPDCFPNQSRSGRYLLHAKPTVTFTVAVYFMFIYASKLLSTVLIN